MTNAHAPTSDAANQAWSLLWNQSVRGSIDLDADDPIAHALREHWASRLPWLAQLSRVVDVGSGPAVLARHLLATSPAGVLSGLTWVCLDAATLPPAGLQAPWLCWMGGTDFASAIAPDGPCDGLVSNFGLEYVSRSELAQACARWLVRGGRLSAVVHATGSVIDLTAQQTLNDIQHALVDAQLFDRAHDLIQAMATLPIDPSRRQQHGVETRAAYNLVVDDLKARMVERGRRVQVWIDMLTALTGFIREARDGRADHAISRCAELGRAYDAETLRLRAMRASAIGPQEQAALADLFSQAGLSRPDWHAIRAPIGLVGWHLTAVREGDDMTAPSGPPTGRH
jgi:hypothetical protein